MQLQTILNQTTGDHLSGQVINQHLTSQIDITGFLSDVSRGDILSHAGNQYYVLFRTLQSGLYSNPYTSSMALRANQDVTVTRSGSIVDNLKCHCSIQRLPGDKLHDLLAHDTAHSLPLRDEADCVATLMQAVAMLQDPADADLATAIQNRIDRHGNSLRIFVQAGNGIAIGDSVTVDGFQSATVVTIDRRSLPGLELLTCTPESTTKPSLFHKRKGK